MLIAHCFEADGWSLVDIALNEKWAGPEINFAYLQHE